MATKKKENTVVESVNVSENSTVKYKGSQLLKLEKFRNRVARVLIKPDELYSIEDVEKLILNFMKKKG